MYCIKLGAIEITARTITGCLNDFYKMVDTQTIPVGGKIIIEKMPGAFVNSDPPELGTIE